MRHRGISQIIIRPAEIGPWKCDFSLLSPDAASISSYTHIITVIASYAAHARAKARECSLGEDPFAEVTSSRVCLPHLSSMNGAPMGFWVFSHSDFDGATLAQIGHQ